MNLSPVSRVLFACCQCCWPEKCRFTCTPARRRNYCVIPILGKCGFDASKSPRCKVYNTRPDRARTG